MWTTKADKKALQLSLGRQFKHHLGIGPSEKISYLAHSDARRLTQTQRATDLLNTSGHGCLAFELDVQLCAIGLLPRV